LLILRIQPNVASFKMKGFAKAACRHTPDQVSNAAGVDNFFLYFIFYTVRCGFQKPVNVATSGSRKSKILSSQYERLSNPLNIVGFELEKTSSFGKTQALSNCFHRNPKEKFHYF
jgi:hypothetical protein